MLTLYLLTSQTLGLQACSALGGFGFGVLFVCFFVVFLFCFPFELEAHYGAQAGPQLLVRGNLLP